MLDDSSMCDLSVSTTFEGKGTNLNVGIIRFLKLYRSFRLYYMVESRTIYPNLWRVVNLIHILLLLAHWFGCFYYLLSELENFVGEWSYREPIDDYATLSRKYLGSVYWSTLTLTTIGDLATPATNLQYMFTILSYLIGVFIFATIVGQVGTVITNRNASRLEFERLLDGAKLYMRHHKVPRNMQRRVQRWYDYSWSRGRMQGGGDINSALGILPDKLKTELALHVNLKTLKKVPDLEILNLLLIIFFSLVFSCNPSFPLFLCLLRSPSSPPTFGMRFAFLSVFCSPFSPFLTVE
ncbi:cyclic nucleotide-gated cation channel alpha-3 [Trichonephila inaurata madagascariensis]|uniref:Cyclic nucleotide-gated cation channel alpha-3 n=1 Tax=Trichonephila inaurata madagascariensis TaxID=2747483 RepID=A0A8X7CNE4_9ARAC|nr:cyclic nucleotide-gated cation channel alpha-3 [Trichonephila inaurata madagascariensis]